MRLSKYSIGVLSLAALTAISGCISSSNGPSASDQKASDAAVSQASTDLGTTLSQMSDVSQFQYGKEDLTSLQSANDNFDKALKLNPGNNNAKLGSAITEVLLAAQSPGISSQINKTLNVGSPMNMSLPKNAALARIGILQKVAVQETLPEFHQIQDSVANILLPALEDGISKLQGIYNDPSFSMTLTMDSATRRIGHPEVAIILAGFKATHALATLLLAYDYDIDSHGSYDYLRILDTLGFDSLPRVPDYSQLTQPQKDALDTLTQLLKPGSPFLAVRPAWKTRLANVNGEIAEALSILNAGVGSIIAQTDDTFLLHACPQDPNVLESGCIQTSSLTSAQAGLDSAQKYLNQPFPVQIADTTILVNIAAYFSVQDYKQMLPFYGFYPATDWSKDKPVVFFTTASGTETGNLKTVTDLLNNADSLGTPEAEVIAQLKPIIHWQDPTFQGFLPGGTEEKVWAIILKLSNAGTKPLSKASASTLMSQNFALSLVGRN